MGSSFIQDQDLVYIVYDKRRRWIRKVEKGQRFQCDRGYLKFDDIIGKVEFGTVVKIEPNGNKIQLLKPLPADIVTKMGRESQIIYPEDIGLILMYTGIGPGSTVVEAGCGSGSLTSIMGYYVRPSGHIYSYDIRDVAVKQALKNVKRVLRDDSGVVSI
jgi:tRNA (adenine57-N1/adenine58-N1)-methyltransferase